VTFANEMPSSGIGSGSDTPLSLVHVCVALYNTSLAGDADVCTWSPLAKILLNIRQLGLYNLPGSPALTSGRSSFANSNKRNLQ